MRTQDTGPLRLTAYVPPGFHGRLPVPLFEFRPEGAQGLLYPPDGDVQVAAVELDADEVQPKPRARDRRRAESRERIEYELHPVEAVEPQAILRQPRGERRWVWPVLLPAVDRVVGAVSYTH